MRIHPTRVHLLPLFLLFLIFAGNAAFAANSDHYLYHIKDKSAHASFGFPDASGCIWTSINVYAVESAVHASDLDQSSKAYIFVSLNTVDRCNGWWTLSSSSGEQVLDPRMLAFTGNLGGAAVVGDIVLYDRASGTPHTVGLDLTWTGIGESWSGRQSETYQEAAYRYTYRFVGSSRDAEATGTVLLDGAVFSSGTANYANLYNSRNGYMEVRQ
jgi:hypothetical protein